MSMYQDNSLRHRTFSQRHGYVPLPEPMRLETISEDLRRECFNAVCEFLCIRHQREFYKKAPFIRSVLGECNKLPEVHISSQKDETIRGFEELSLKSEFNRFLDYLEIFFNHLRLTYGTGDRFSGFVNHIDFLFKKHAAAYWLDKTHCQFVPQASKEQGEATKQALKTISEGNLVGATSHLRRASGHINAGQYADSIAHSIGAVESVARSIDSSSNTLNPALNKLEKDGVLKHPALKEAFSKLYGYTSSEQGIRHPLINQSTANVGLNEAIFMFGACASFAAYLANSQLESP